MDWIEVVVVCWAVLLILCIVADKLGIRVKVRYWTLACIASILLGTVLELESFLDPACKTRGGVHLRNVLAPYQCYDRASLRVLAPVSAVRVPTYPR